MSTMLATPHAAWAAPRLARGKPTSAGTLALAGSVAVHAAFLLAPGAPPGVPEPPAPAMTVVQVQLHPREEATPSASSLPPVNAAASVAPRPVVTKAARAKPAEARDAIAQRETPAPVAESTLATRPVAASVQDHALPGEAENSAAPLSRQSENAVALAAARQNSTPVAFLDAPEPEYPESAREEGQEGLVVLRVRVSSQGRPVEIRIGTSSGIRALDAAALAGVRRWSFRPARALGQDIEAWMDVPIRFRLK